MRFWFGGFGGGRLLQRAVCPVRWRNWLCQRSVREHGWRVDAQCEGPSEAACEGAVSGKRSEGLRSASSERGRVAPDLLFARRALSSPTPEAWPGSEIECGPVQLSSSVRGLLNPTLVTFGVCCSRGLLFGSSHPLAGWVSLFVRSPSFGRSPHCGKIGMPPEWVRRFPRSISRGAVCKDAFRALSRALHSLVWRVKAHKCPQMRHFLRGHSCRESVELR